VLPSFSLAGWKGVEAVPFVTGARNHNNYMSTFALATHKTSNLPGAPTGAAAAPNNPVPAGLAPNSPVLPVAAAGAPNPVVAGLAPNPVEVDPKRPPPAAGEGAAAAPNPVDAPNVEPAVCQRIIIVSCRVHVAVGFDD
jgi:hypothetical protein